ncbi:hypothetical protein MMC31_006596 [Peltigera leucophlebia]|nr:hypothetical protein [Peltigera leucophlebia]
MEGQDAEFEHEIIHKPPWLGRHRADMRMREFLTYSSRTPIQLEDEGSDMIYDYWKGNHPPFEPIKTLGMSRKSTVEKVLSIKSQRVLARKLINFESKQTQLLAKTEINCLQGLRHPHIVAFVGAYLEGKNIGILLYPAAEWNLEEFMVDVPSEHNNAQRYHLRRYFVCLAQAVSYLHDSKIRHKDIKPTNILIDSFGNILLADFGISLKAPNEAQMITQTNTSRSYDYCSPEVIARRKRFPSSDVFSLGAVYAEMITVVLNKSLTDFRKFRTSRDGNKSFHQNLGNVEIWMKELAKSLDGGEIDGRHDEMIKTIPTIMRMLAYERNTPSDTDSGRDRPSASGLWKNFQNVSPYICRDCDPRHHSPWQYESLPGDEHHLGRLRFLEDLPQESLHSLPKRKTVATNGNSPHPTNSQDDRRATGELKTEILYDPLAQTLRIVTRAEIKGNLVLLNWVPTVAASADFLDRRIKC